jgi:hypothetical protein
MAASGRGPRGAGEAGEAIDAALSTEAAARRAQVYARQSFQRLTCAFAQLFRSWFWLHGTAPGRIMRHAGRGCFAPGMGDTESIYSVLLPKDASRRLVITRVHFERYQRLVVPFASHRRSNHLVLRHREAASKDASGAANGTARWTLLRDTTLRILPQNEGAGFGAIPKPHRGGPTISYF